MTDNSIKESNADTFSTPGQILHSYREKQKLSIEDIAKRIHLDEKIIESIENDSPEGMPAAIYVRGYLRSYAKIVDADADEVIKLYNNDSPPPPPEILPEVKPPSQVSSNDKPVKAFTYFITLGLVLLLLIWYQSNFVVDKQANAEQTNAPTNINGTDVTYSVVNHPDSWQSPTINSEDKIEKPVSPEQVDALKQITAIEEMPAIESNSMETTQEETSTENSSMSIRGFGPDKIEMTLTNDSWIEMQDVNSNRLFHDLARGGKQYSINGTAPITVLLGFSDGVTIKFNGKPFDINPHSNGGVAHFTLPE